MAGQTALRFGLWYSFRNPRQWQCDYVELYAAHLRQIAWAESIGYDDVWLTEHHFCDDGHAPSILPLAAAVAATTTRIRIGTSVLLREGDTVDFDGKHYRIKGARVQPPPVQQPRPPMWVGGFAPAAAKRAARLGAGR